MVCPSISPYASCYRCCPQGVCDNAAVRSCSTKSSLASSYSSGAAARRTSCAQVTPLLHTKFSMSCPKVTPSFLVRFCSCIIARPILHICDDLMTIALLRIADIDFERNCKPGCPRRSPTVRSYSAKVKASLLVQFCPFRCHEHNLTHAGCGGVGHYNEDRYRILNQGPEGGAVLHGTNSFWHQTSPSSDPR